MNPFIHPEYGIEWRVCVFPPVASLTIISTRSFSNSELEFYIVKAIMYNGH